MSTKTKSTKVTKTNTSDKTKSATPTTPETYEYHKLQTYELFDTVKEEIVGRAMVTHLAGSIVEAVSDRGDVLTFTNDGIKVTLLSTDTNLLLVPEPLPIPEFTLVNFQGDFVENLNLVKLRNGDLGIISTVLHPGHPDYHSNYKFFGVTLAQLEFEQWDINGLKYTGFETPLDIVGLYINTQNLNLQQAN